MAQHGPADLQQELAKVANEIVANGRGILAADEPGHMINDRMAKVGVTDFRIEMRRRYRHLLFSTKNLCKNLGGVILEDETFYQKDENGKRIVDALTEQGIKLGVKDRVR